MPGTSSQRRALLAASTGSGTAITRARRNRIAGSSLMPAITSLAASVVRLSWSIGLAISGAQSAPPWSWPLALLPAA